MTIQRTGRLIEYSAEPRFSRLARVLEQQLTLDVFDASVVVDVLKDIGPKQVKELLEEV